MRYMNVAMTGQYLTLVDLVLAMQLRYELDRADGTTPTVCIE